MEPSKCGGEGTEPPNWQDDIRSGYGTVSQCPPPLEDESSHPAGSQTGNQSSRTQFIPLSLSHRLLTFAPCSFFHEYERDPSIFLTQLRFPTHPT